MAKKKHPVTKTRSRPAKPIPAMYPPPAPIELVTPQKIVAVDLKTDAKSNTNTVTFVVEGAQPPEMSQYGAPEDWLVNVVHHDLNTNEITVRFSLPPEKDKRRLNLLARLQQYAATCLRRIEPHWGERPKDIPPKKWQNREERVNAMDALPETAPAPAQDHLLALQTLNRLVKELVDAGDWPESIDRAICEAIDLGKLLQRGQVEIDFGPTVESSRRSANGRAKGNPKKTDNKSERDKLIRQEFIKIRDQGFDTEQSEIIPRMLGQPWLVEPSDECPNGVRMPSESKIQKVTVGLGHRKTSRNQTKKR